MNADSKLGNDTIQISINYVLKNWYLKRSFLKYLKFRNKNIPNNLKLYILI